MVEINRHDFVLVADVADFKSPEYSLIVRKAKALGAYAKFGQDEFVARDLVLAQQVSRRRGRRSAGASSRSPREYSVSYYRKISTPNRMRNIIATIESGLTSRRSRIDEFNSNLENEDQPKQISAILGSLLDLRQKQSDADSRLKAAREKLGELEAEESRILQSLRDSGSTGRTSGSRRSG